MKLFNKIMEADESKWLWFGGILFASSIPMILRFLISLDCKEISSFDIKDCLFAGIAINLSNFNLIGIREFEYKVALSFGSVICLLVITFAIGVFLANEANPQSEFLCLKSISVIIVIASTCINYSANHYLLK